MFGDDAQHAWPRWGEYDILESIHVENYVSRTARYSWHVSAGTSVCFIEGNHNFAHTRASCDQCRLSDVHSIVRAAFAL